MTEDFLADLFSEEEESPFDFWENIFQSRELSYQRTGWDRLLIEKSGRFASYVIEMSWIPEHQMVQCSCSSDLCLDSEYETLAGPLFMKINRGLRWGHFEMSEVGRPVFRQTILMGLAEQNGIDHADAFIQIAVAECDRHHSVFAVLKSHMERLSEAGFSLEMDDFLPRISAINDNPDAHVIGSSIDLAMMDVQGEG